jgi:hypothetical protein
MGFEDVPERLAAPFEEHEVKFKPAVVSGSRALALPYVDARAIQDRLDEVLGVAGDQTLQSKDKGDNSTAGKAGCGGNRSAASRSRPGRYGEG